MATDSSPIGSSPRSPSTSGAPSAPQVKRTSSHVDQTASTLGSAKVGETASVRDTAPTKDSKKEKAIASSGDKKNIFQRIAQCFKNCFAGLSAWVARAFASKDNKAALKAFGETRAEQAKAFADNKGPERLQSVQEFLAFAKMHTEGGPLDGKATAEFLGLSILKDPNTGVCILDSESTAEEIQEGYKGCVFAANIVATCVEYKRAGAFFKYLAEKKPSAKQAVFIYGQLPPAQRAFIESRFTVLCKYLNKEDKGFKAFLLTTDETKWSLMLAAMHTGLFLPLPETPAT